MEKLYSISSARIAPYKQNQANKLHGQGNVQKHPKKFHRPRLAFQSVKLKFYRPKMRLDMDKAMS